MGNRGIVIAEDGYRDVVEDEDYAANLAENLAEDLAEDLVNNLAEDLATKNYTVDNLIFWC